MSIRRSIIVCALFILALSASPALAHQSRSAALAQERYLESFGSGDGAALAQERYYSSYGAPEPLRLPQSAPAPSDDSPLLIALIVVAVGLGVAGAGATQFRRVRGRRAAGATS
jgi:hypothetical protein